MNRTDQKILVAIYLRLSKKDGDLSTSSKEESNSISNQRKLIQNYLMQHPEMTFVQEYCDMKIAKMIQRAGIEYRENRRKYRLLAHLLLPGAFIFLRLNTA